MNQPLRLVDRIRAVDRLAPLNEKKYVPETIASSKIQHSKKQKTLVEYFAVMDWCPGNLIWQSDSEDFHP